MKDRLASLLSCSLGNILEWYDFGLFTIFSDLFSRLFFPTENKLTAHIATLMLFAVGFLCRPLGGLFFGFLGDKIGRAKTLRFSILMISIPTLLVGCLPTYQTIGILAPIVLCLIRIWQGLSIGGEYSGNLIYLAESAPKKYRATLTTFASMGANLGILLAGLVGMAASFLFEPVLAAWGWRIPYLLSGILCIIIYLFRLQIQESNVFDYAKRKKLLVENPIKTIFQKNKLDLLKTLGIVCMGSTYYYFLFVYLPLFLQEKSHVSIQHVSFLMTSCIFLMMLLNPVAGLICDHIGRRKMMLMNAIIITAILVPGYYLLTFHSLMVIASVLIIFTLASTLEQGGTSITVVENFPLPARYTGVSFAYNIGNGILAGTVPIICQWLSQSQLIVAPAIYIAAYAMITGFVIFFFIPETLHSHALTQTSN